MVVLVEGVIIGAVEVVVVEAGIEMMVEVIVLYCSYGCGRN